MESHAVSTGPGTVVVGIDPTQEPTGPLHLAGMLAGALGAPLLLATVFPHHPLLDGPEDEEQRRLRAAAREDLLALAQGLDGVGEADAVVVAAGSPAAALQELSEHQATALLVIGSTTRGPIRRVLPGSVAERLLSGAACPVAVAPHGYTAADARLPGVVAVGYDGSPEARRALAFARELAAATSATLRIVTVHENLPFGIASVSAVDPAQTVNQAMEQRLREEHDTALAAQDIPAEGVFTTGSPAAVLAEQSHEVGLLVTGSRCFGPLGAVLLGGTTHPLLRSAACPLVVTPRDRHA